LLLRPIDLFVGVSKYVSDRLVFHGIDSGRVETVYNGVDLERFSPVQEMILSRNWVRDARVKAATYVGQLIHEKAWIRWRRRLSAEEGGYLRVAGDGSLKEQLVRSTRERIGIKIRFLGNGA
jgi:glycosyltransferase involved in cell wall biosynthesis